MNKFATYIILFFVTAITFASATELNENSLYNGKINKAYNQADLPLLPGEWKIYDLEKSGSVASGNFFVYATLVPSSFGPSDNAFFNDGISYAVLGSKSEETDYRRSFYACDAGWITDAETTTSNIDTRGSGNFEETCSAKGEINPFNQFFFTDCGEVCIEVNIALMSENYNINEGNFEEASNDIFNAIRNTVAGSSGADMTGVINKYKK